MGQIYTLSPALKSDYRYYYNLTKRNMFKLFTKHWGGWDDAACRAAFKLNQIQILRIQGRRAGYINVRKEIDHLYLENIQISPLHQKKGIGEHILQNIIHSNSNLNIKLTVFDDNPALNLYKRLGFKEISRDGADILMIKQSSGEI